MSLPTEVSKDHHVGSPPTHFTNPWQSAGVTHGLTDILSMRFGRQRNFVPVPENREGLVNVRKPDWGLVDSVNSAAKLKATWIGHASWFVEFASIEADTATDIRDQPPSRGVSVLLDPLFSERTSPLKWLGPKRYTPTPCLVQDLPEVDIVVISHNHYDHLDYDTIIELRRRSSRTHFICPLKNKAWFTGVGIPDDQVHELDWWEAVQVTVPGAGSVAVACTPAQHNSARTPFDRNRALWSSWALGSLPFSNPHSKETSDKLLVQKITGNKIDFAGHRLYFAGDTGYRYVSSANPTEEEEATRPRCPAFKEIGEHLGPFDLALLPIGLCTPRDFMSPVHCAPEDSICVHQDIKSKRSIGMHYGTVRGGLSAQYEDVRDPPLRFKAACEKAGLFWGKDVGLCDIGETVLVD